MIASQETLDQATLWLLLLPPVLGLLWAAYETWMVSRVKLDGHVGTGKATDPLFTETGARGDVLRQVEAMKIISKHISDGAWTFLAEEYKYMVVYIIFASCILGPFINMGTMISFIIGAVTSMLCGFIGMMIATYANVRTTHEAWKDLAPAFNVAFRAGSVMGFVLVSLGVVNLVALVYIYRLPSFYGLDNAKELFEAIAGYGLGGSSIALFARVGGGIYTKAADVGADLSGKNEYGMAEDDPRNPACIADNVGDNVGDVAGMGADLFGSLAEASCAALVIAGASSGVRSGVSGISDTFSGLMFPVVLSSTGIIVGILTSIYIQLCYPVKVLPQIEMALKRCLLVSTILETPTVLALAWIFLPERFYLEGYGVSTWWRAGLSVCMGLWAGLIIGYITEYYTSHSYTPVREISRTQVISAATGIIYGLALGYSSCIVPVMCIGASVCVAHLICGMYGIALAALGMLATLTMGLTIDAYGPISDNAGGIAEMSGLGADVRYRTDALDAAGNTTAAIGKGFAIGSAALVSLALFGAYTVRAKVDIVDVLDPWTFTGLLYGAMMPYWFSAMTMKSVGVAATDMVRECLEQFPKIITGQMEPRYGRCIEISTRAAIREMIAPGALVICSPIVAGMVFGKNCTAGVLAGGLVSGVQMAISASNTGGAWDNAKKYIETGALGSDHSKGSAAHKNAVTGDTVGDPLKDTSGPSLNILVKLSAIISLVFGSMLSDHFSNPAGGPRWLSVASYAT
eukprot:Lankesteria_metandrocarpae@DN2086_c0_g1_i1.p1